MSLVERRTDFSCLESDFRGVIWTIVELCFEELMFVVKKVGLSIRPSDWPGWSGTLSWAVTLSHTLHPEYT
jgi:hypothetical protein